MAFDSTLNFIPGQQGSQPMMEGLFGIRMGVRLTALGNLCQGAAGVHLLQQRLPKLG